MVEMPALEKSFRATADRLVPPAEARATANEFILRNLGDRMGAGAPTFVTLPNYSVWAVPILFRQTDADLRIVGEILVHGLTGELLGSTTTQEIDQRVRSLFAA